MIRDSTIKSLLSVKIILKKNLNFNKYILLVVYLAYSSDVIRVANSSYVVGLKQK